MVEIWEIMSSPGRVKVLQVIARNGPLNITRIVRLTGLNYNVVHAHIRFLTEAGVLECYTLGRSRICDYSDNKLAKAIKEFLISV